MNILEFALPDNLNGEQLKDELGAEQVNVREQTLVVVGNLDRAFIENGIKNHIPKLPKPLTVADKLASVGLNLDDLKAALGL